MYRQLHNDELNVNRIALDPYVEGRDLELQALTLFDVHIF